ncbi:LysE family translocator [Pontivivens insulae]|uniref:Cysteine/O-acetylserine efflux protein n=1 Tax=Pontivivens insulae TaxID=1639689 RepID=A0A2R8A7N9_9RHOB|nr:LysE family translocator [Pontivivens insulae]RED18151.1 threonine/homoserine/homoserine lactone efflux protein [Pontivivens insulae]SPF28048.1 Cysteine/O-acetylserine efflux protein [Pontivivens insulae]
MTLETVIAIMTLAAATVWTPGPNNALLASSGARFGYRRTLPHAMGVAWGFPLMCFCMALGLGEVFRAEPLIREALRWVGAALLLWIAWKTLNASAPGSDDSHAKPWTFFQAMGFQWINPKAWMMAISMISQFVTGENPLLEAAVVSGVYALVGLTSSSGWALFGVAMQRFLSTPLRLKLFNGLMAGLIVITVAALVTSDLSV